MLDTIGASTLEDLYAHLPEDVRFNGALNIPPGKSEYEIVDYFRARGGGKRQRLRQLSGRRRLSSLPPGAGGRGRFARRVSDFLHAVPSRDLAGHADQRSSNSRP